MYNLLSTLLIVNCTGDTKMEQECLKSAALKRNRDELEALNAEKVVLDANRKVAAKNINSMIIKIANLTELHTCIKKEKDNHEKLIYVIQLFGEVLKAVVVLKKNGEDIGDILVHYLEIRKVIMKIPEFMTIFYQKEYDQTLDEFEKIKYAKIHCINVYIMMLSTRLTQVNNEMMVLKKEANTQNEYLNQLIHDIKKLRNKIFYKKSLEKKLVQ
ncbi:hypothetical protein ECANGB1_789 [Enterospora canceri]|uniref:Uncharacterized protein n=1 Tax=Enterospora canceri TaxID=1081671 RepID=A0A1Y1S7G6_9MICR|nr:hypothetical protein ECANGB1_789 [Enterospora canceri]